jgi:uncharacterized protein YdaU (DUF1376 family)
MPLYIGDYLADTQHLTATQHGAYLLLIMHYWQHGGLPSDEAAIAGISRQNRDQWRSNCRTLAALFEPGWKHKRIEKELKKASEISEKRAYAGRKGASKTNFQSRTSYPAIVRQTGTQSQSPIESSSLSASKSAEKLNGHAVPHQPQGSLATAPVDGALAHPATSSPTLTFSKSLEQIVREKGWVP